MIPRNVVFCPKCLNPIQAMDYFESGGLSDWRVEGPGVNVTCHKCGYQGPPVEATAEVYEKIIKKRK